MYANVILDRWPDSGFARLVQNPTCSAPTP